MPVDSTILILREDITRQEVDAIVNAANPGLLGGGGVDGAIHRAAGAGLLAACVALPETSPGVRCPTGEARITEAFALPARWVIHTVGPIWHGGTRGEPALLAACYRHCLALASAYGVRRMAFPAISCGIYGYPPAQAATICRDSLRQGLPGSGIEQVRLCIVDDRVENAYRNAFELD